jgi:hypothetical protein
VRGRRVATAWILGALVCGGVVHISRPPAPGLDPDAMSYVGAGESLARTGRLRIPDADWWETDSTSALAQFPAGFPAAIAFGMGAGLEPVQSARVVEALAALGTVVALVLLLQSTAGPPAGVIAVLLLVATPAIFNNYIRVLSEPLFLLCLVLTLAAMVLRPQRPFLAGLGAAAAELVRYVGISVGIAVLLWALGRSGPWRTRVERVLEAALPIGVAHVWWRVRLFTVGAESPPITHWQRGYGGTLREGGRTLVAWLAPSIGSGAVTTLLALVVLAGSVVLLRRTLRRMPRDGRATARRRLFNAIGLLALCYAAVLALSRGFVGGGIPFDERLLSPLFLLATVAAAACLRIRWSAWSGPMRALVATICVAWAAGGMMLNLDQLAGLQEDGWGYSGRKWQPSAEQQWLQTEGRHYQLFSNNPMLVYFLTGRPSRELPDTADAGSLRDFRGTLEEENGAMIGFDEDYRRMDPAAFLAAVLPLHPLARFDHMTVWTPGDAKHPPTRTQP